MTNEIVTTASRIPYNKGYYDAADSRNKHRLAYLVMTSWFGSAMKGSFWALIVLISLFVGVLAALQIGFVLGAFGKLLIMTERFKALD